MAIEYAKAKESKRATTARKDAHRVLSVKATVDPKQESGNQASPVDTIHKSKRGRPSTGFDKTSYMKEYMQKRRAKKPRD